MWEIARETVMILKDKLTTVYLPTGFLKVTNVYFVLLILMSKSYCRAFVVFQSLETVCPCIDNIPLHCRCRIVLDYVINVREIKIKTCRLSCDKAVELWLTVHFHFRLLTVLIIPRGFYRAFATSLVSTLFWHIVPPHSGLPYVVENSHVSGIWNSNTIWHPLLLYTNKGLNSTCFFLMELWKTEDPRVNFEKRFAHYEIYTWTLCHSFLHEKQTSRI